MNMNLGIGCCKNLNGIKPILICILIIIVWSVIYTITTAFDIEFIDVYPLINAGKTTSSKYSSKKVHHQNASSKITSSKLHHQKNYPQYFNHNNLSQLKKNNSALKYLSILNDSQRISYYMGKWYMPYHNLSIQVIDYNCSFFYKKYHLTPNVHRYSIFDDTKNHKKNKTIAERHNSIQIYIKPFWGFLNNSIQMNSFKCNESNNNGDILLALGDVFHHAKHGMVPVFGKAREIIGNYSQINSHIRKNSLILLQGLNYDRHWKVPCELYRRILTKRSIPWNKKKNKVIWRGSTTGILLRESFVKQYFNSSNSMIDVGFGNTQNKIKFKHLKNPYIKQGDQLKNKYLVSIEGNDVATNLKWILMSNSVVFMLQPRVETWLMEGLLKPYVHYVPLTMTKSIIIANGTEIIQYQWNLEEQLQFCLDNDDVCHQIAENGKLFMLGNMFCKRTHEKEMEARLLDMYCLNNKLIFSD